MTITGHSNGLKRRCALCGGKGYLHSAVTRGKAYYSCTCSVCGASTYWWTNEKYVRMRWDNGEASYVSEPRKEAI